MCLYGQQKEESTSRQPDELYNLQVPRHKNYIAQISLAFNIKIDQYLLLGSARHVTSRNRHAPTSRMNEAGKGLYDIKLDRHTKQHTVTVDL